jgi:hypothetical protein
MLGQTLTNLVLGDTDKKMQAARLASIGQEGTNQELDLKSYKDRGKHYDAQ